MNKINKAYYSIILEEVLTDDNVVSRMSNLPSPLNEYFMNMRDEMLKAVDVEDDHELATVNSKVNVWRDKIINFWVENSKKLSQWLTNEINDILMIIVSRYTELMHGCNTGY